MSKSKAAVSSWLFIAVAALLIVLDQLTKTLAISNLKLGIDYPVIGELLAWRLVYNDSAAFSLGFGYTWILAVISSVATIVVIWFARRITAVSWALMAGVFLAGVVGNLIDRLFREPSFGNGHVVDFIKIPFNFPVFNFADIFIVTMATLTVIRVFRGENLGGLMPRAK